MTLPTSRAGPWLIGAAHSVGPNTPTFAVKPEPSSAVSGDYAGLRFLAGQATWTDPGDLAADGGILTATFHFTAQAVGFPAHGILGEVSGGGGLVFSAASDLQTEELFCVGATFGVGNSCAGFLHFDDKLGFSLSTNRGFGHPVHDALADPSFPAPDPAHPVGVGLIDVIVKLTITGAPGALAGVDSYIFLVRPTS